MSIAPFDGDTFLAFIDISGFKNIMKTEGKKKVFEVLKHFYSASYNTISDINQKYARNYNETPLSGIIISDCAIVYVNRDFELKESLQMLLEVVQAINTQMLELGRMLVTSISYGYFSYSPRSEFFGIRKLMLSGNGYLNAFLDTEGATPKITPGQCRIVKDGLPDQLYSLEDFQRNGFKLISPRKGDEDHLYFYWHLANPDKIKSFEQNYVRAQGLKATQKYERMCEALIQFQPYPFQEVV